MHTISNSSVANTNPIHDHKIEKNRKNLPDHTVVQIGHKASLIKQKALPKLKQLAPVVTLRAQEGTKSNLQTLYKAEKDKWAAHYVNNEEFRLRIRDFIEERTNLMEDIKKGNISFEEVDKRSMQLGTKLARAYGLINAEGRYLPDVGRRIMMGGIDYANSSIRANFWQQLPGILRSVAFLGLNCATAAAGDVGGDQYIRFALNIIYVGSQTYTFYKVPFYQAATQSEDVAKRNLKVEFQPNVSASVLIEESGKTGKLLGVKFLEDRIKMLEVIKKNLKVELPVRIEKLQKKIEVLEQEIASSRSDSLDYQKNRQLSDKLDATRTELKLYRAWNDAPDIEAAIDKEISELRKKLLIECLFMKLSFQPAQGTNKNMRNWWNIGTGVMGILADMAGTPLHAAIWQAGGLTTQILQVINYSTMHGISAELDEYARYAVMFQIAAITGVGNIAPNGKKPDPKRLNSLMVGPLQRRINLVKELLVFDRGVYRTAIVYCLVPKDARLSYHASAVYLGNCKSKEDREKYVKDSKGHGASEEGIRKALNILKLYEENEENISRLEDGEIDELLGDDSTLPDDSKNMLEGALKYAAFDKEEFAKWDDELASKKGKTESLSDLASVNQLTQKIGMNFAKIIAGPSGPLLLKLIASAIQSILYAASSANEYRSLIKYISASANALSILGPIIGLFLAKATHEHIAKKELHRQRDRERGPSMPNAGISDYSYLNALRGQDGPTGFDTLAAKRIPVKDLPRVVPYDRQTTTASDIWAQMQAPEFRKFLEYLKLKPASFDIETLKEADKLKEDFQTELNHSINRILQSNEVDEYSSEDIDYLNSLTRQPDTSSNDTLAAAALEAQRLIDILEVERLVYLLDRHDSANEDSENWEEMSLEIRSDSEEYRDRIFEKNFPRPQVTTRNPDQGQANDVELESTDDRGSDARYSSSYSDDISSDSSSEIRNDVLAELGADIVNVGQLRAYGIADKTWSRLLSIHKNVDIRTFNIKELRDCLMLANLIREDYPGDVGANIDALVATIQSEVQRKTASVQ